jgi:hypothetical protein
MCGVISQELERGRRHEQQVATRRARLDDGAGPQQRLPSLVYQVTWLLVASGSKALSHKQVKAC